MAAKILILGGSSYVGRHLFATLGPARALATFNATPIAGGVRFDTLAMRLADVIGDPAQFSHAVILLGDTQPDSCIADPARSDRLNVESVCRVFDQLAELGIKPVFTSSEFVFDGEAGNYTETDTARPILLYGEQKLRAERYLQGMGIPHAILRLAKVYGDDIADGTLFSGWLTGLRHGSELKCAADQAFSPVFVGDVVNAIVKTVASDLDGLYHVSGNRRFRRVELLEMVIAELRRRFPDFHVKVEPCSIHDFQLPERRPVDVSMVADKLIGATGFAPADPAEICATMIRDNHSTLEARIHER